MIIEFIKDSGNYRIGSRMATDDPTGNPLINQGIAKVISAESEKLIGSDGCEIVVGATPYVVPVGYVAYACSVRVDGTMIKSITQLKGNVSTIITTKSWENISLLAGVDYIPFQYPITSITLNGTLDSVTLWLESIYY